MSIDFEALRPRFPLLRDRVYCDNQCFGCFPEEMLADLDDYRRTLFLRNRAIDTWVDRMAELTDMLERLLHAPSGSVALRDSATAAQASIAAAIEPSGVRRNIVIAPELDFDSSRFLWSQQERRGFTLVEIGRGRAQLDAAELAAAIDERTAIVALPLVSPRTGALLPVADVTRCARQAGAVSIIDAYQAVGVVPVDVARLDVDVLVGGTHKWLYGGGTGLAFLYVAPALAERLPVVYPGWFGHRALVSGDPRFAPLAGARRFQQGSPAMEPIYTARAGLRFVLEVGVDAIRDRTLALTERVVQAARQHGLKTKTPAARAAVICIDVADPAAIVHELGNRGIDVDTRPGAGLRVGPHPCLTVAECDAVMAGIASVARETKSSR